MIRAGLVMGVAGLGAAACGSETKKTVPVSQASSMGAAAPHPADPASAWARLAAGNKRWVAGTPQRPDATIKRREEVASAQEPFASIVSCIDSRVPPELVFDEGLGDLFVIRTAAQTIDGLVEGAVEYGPVEDDTPLIVVMGHQRCGAVTAAVKSIKDGHKLPGHLSEIVDTIKPAYNEAKSKGGDIVDQTVRANTLRAAAELADDGSLKPKVGKGLGIVAAYYSLDTGQVSVLKANGFTPS